MKIKLIKNVSLVFSINEIFFFHNFIFLCFLISGVFFYNGHSVFVTFSFARMRMCRVCVCLSVYLMRMCRHLWSILKRYVRKKYCNTIEELQQRVTKFFNKLSLKTRQNFIMHFKTVMRKIIEKKGDWSHLQTMILIIKMINKSFFFK
jgi:hypothetical protein